jgi:hypothetical protein
MYECLSFNKKIAKKILIDLVNVKNGILSLKNLEENINKNLDAIDSTFPTHLRGTILEVLPKISEHQMKQYAANLNTCEEGTYNEVLPVKNIFDFAIDALTDFISQTTESSS